MSGEQTNDPRRDRAIWRSLIRHLAIEPAKALVYGAIGCTILVTAAAVVLAAPRAVRFTECPGVAAVQLEYAETSQRLDNQANARAFAQDALISAPRCSAAQVVDATASLALAKGYDRQGQHTIAATYRLECWTMVQEARRSSEQGHDLEALAEACSPALSSGAPAAVRAVHTHHTHSRPATREWRGVEKGGDTNTPPPWRDDPARSERLLLLTSNS